MTNSSGFDPTKGICAPLDEWLEFNAHGAFATEGGLARVAPFPPPELMKETSGLIRPQDFANHGLLICRAFAGACPLPLSEFGSILDFGVGVGRLARMFKGFSGTYVGVDVDRRNIDWITENLVYVAAVRTLPRRPLPFGDGFFEAIISVSVFTHMNEADCQFYLNELKRVLKPGGYFLASLQGERALQRASEEVPIKEMLCLSLAEVAAAQKELSAGSGFCFAPQITHLTSDAYDYGMTFVSQSFVEEIWGREFCSVQVRQAAIADFQDIAVFRNA
ncbi:MAG: class I SAM-dependent methyltransferase [Methylocella sp.]